MFAYCGNNPVNRVDYTGLIFSEIWEFAKTAVAEIGKAMGVMSPAYAGCGGAALGDGPLPFGDIAGLAGAALLTVGAIGYGIYQAAQAPTISIPKTESNTISIPKTETKEEVVQGPPRPEGTTYYHSTTYKNAMSIMSSGKMYGSVWEGGLIYAWKFYPSKKAVKNSGALQGVIISFKTSATFSPDWGIDDWEALLYGPVVSDRPGPIYVWDVTIMSR